MCELTGMVFTSAVRLRADRGDRPVCALRRLGTLAFRDHARPRKELCRLAGRHFWHSRSGALSGQPVPGNRFGDSIMPQVRILKENLLVADVGAVAKACTRVKR